MAVTTFPIVSGADIDSNSATAKAEPGTIMAFRRLKEWSLVEYVELDNNGVSQGEALITNFATIGQGRVAKAGTADAFSPGFRGIAAATIASQRFGWMYISGYVEKADLSQTVASADLLTTSGSTAGKLTNDRASSFWGATLGLSSTSGTAPFIFAQARGAFATGIGSVILLGVWG